VIEALAAKDNHEAVLPHRLDDYLDAGDLYLAQSFAESNRLLGRDAAGATVANQPVFVDGAEIATGSDIDRLEVEINAQSLKDAATNLVLKGVITEKGEMTRTATRCDAVPNGDG